MWYTLLPAVILMGAVKVYQKYVEYTGFSLFGKDNIVASYATMAVVVLMFIILFIMSVTNNKTAPVYKIRKNIPAGAMCLFAASVTVVDIGCYLPDILLYNSYSLGIIINIVFSALSALGLFILSWVHISSRKPSIPASIFMLAIPMWSAVKLLTALFSNSTNSVIMTDILDVFIYLFLSFYMFYAISVTCISKAKNPVKKLPLFGMPLVALLFTYDVSTAMYFIFNGYNANDYSLIFTAVELTLFAFYVIFFTREVTKYSKNKKDIVIIESEEQLQQLFEKRREENIRRFEENREKEREQGNYYIISENGYDANDPGLPEEKSYGYAHRVYGDYLNENDDTPIITGTTEDETDNGVYGMQEDEKVNRIDNLILEITSGDNDLDLTE